MMTMTTARTRTARTWTGQEHEEWAMVVVIECELGNNLQRGQINWLLFGGRTAGLPASKPDPLKNDGDENKIRRMPLVFYVPRTACSTTVGCHSDAWPWQCGSSAATAPKLPH